MVVVTWQSEVTITECLDSIPSGVPVVVVDNASHDATLERARAARPGVITVEMGRNAGFGLACNHGAKSLPGFDLLLLNPDASLGTGTLEGLMTYLTDHPQVGVVGPRILDATGRLEWSWGQDPTVWVEARRSARLRAGEPPVPHGGPVNWVTGGCCLVRREVWDTIGGFDPDYFLYFEDLDLCRRIRCHGYEVHLVPDLVAVHVRGHSADQASAAVRRHYRDSQKRYHDRYSSPIDRWFMRGYTMFKRILSR